MSQPITTEPGKVAPAAVSMVLPDAGTQQWMARPVIPGCPAGLEYLTQIDQVLIHQRVDVIESFTDWQVANTYVVKNSLGQQIYFAAEESEVCHRQMCKEFRGFVMHIVDNLGQEILRLTRPFKCCVGCCWCADSSGCSHEITVEAPVGQVVGHVRQLKSGCAPRYSITDGNDKPVFVVQGPGCVCDGPCYTRDVDFKIYSLDMAHNVGKISKQYAGCCQEMWTTADNFCISFPMDLDVKAKATLLGAAFLFDFVFFEYKPKN